MSEMQHCTADFSFKFSIMYLHTPSEVTDKLGQ